MTLTITCPAKVNLALSVGPLDPDVGLHPIASWIAAIQFSDTLQLERTKGDRSSFDIGFADDAPRPEPIDWPAEKDLAVRAHALLERHAGRPLPVRAVLRKRVPTGAGLGGGSSDAAGMMRGLNQLFDLQLAECQLIDLARGLGSDVAFFAAGRPAALVTGFGEAITPVTPRPLHLVLILPPLRCATAAVYRAFDAQGGATLDESRVRRLVTLDPLPADAPFNDLATAAMHVEPALRDAHRRAEATLSMPVHVTGSGAAMFALTPSADAAAQLARTLRAQGFTALAAPTIVAV